MLLVSFTGADQYLAEKGTIFNFFPVYKLIIFRRYTSKNMLSCTFFYPISSIRKDGSIVSLKITLVLIRNRNFLFLLPLSILCRR